MGKIAHLIIDVQNRYFHPGDLSKTFDDLAHGAPDTLDKHRQHSLYGHQIAERINAFAAECRAQDITNIYVMHRSAPKNADDEDSLYLVQKGEQEKFIVKSGFDAFFGASASLDKTLKDLGIETVIITGGILGYCIFETAQSAIHAGYRTIVAEDMAFPDIFDFAPDARAWKFDEMRDYGIEVMKTHDIAENLGLRLPSLHSGQPRSPVKTAGKAADKAAQPQTTIPVKTQGKTR